MAARLGISRAYVSTMVTAKVFPAVRRGAKSYIPLASVEQEIERRSLKSANTIWKKKTASASAAPAAPSYDGAIAAKAVGLFNRGGHVREAVQELQVTFEVAEHLWKKYVAAGREVLLDHRACMKLSQLVGWEEKPMTAQGLVAAIMRTIAGAAPGAEDLALSEEEKKQLEEDDAS